MVDYMRKWADSLGPSKDEVISRLSKENVRNKQNIRFEGLISGKGTFEPEEERSELEKTLSTVGDVVAKDVGHALGKVVTTVTPVVVEAVQTVAPVVVEVVQTVAPVVTEAVQTFENVVQKAGQEIQHTTETAIHEVDTTARNFAHGAEKLGKTLVGWLS
jgi:hypothetical protein